MTLFKTNILSLFSVVLVLISIQPSVATAMPTDLNIQVKGLFSQSAVLTVNGHQRILRRGTTSPEGIKLISANSRTAIILFNGQQQTLSLSGNIGTQYSKVSRRNVTIPLNPQGQYLTHGLINGQGVELLVDTGASVVAMSGQQADLLGIEYVTKGIPGYVETASEKVKSYQVSLDQIDIGGLKAHNVHAVVLQGSLPSKILLGMSYLRNVELTEKQGMLNLLEKR